MTIPAVKRMQAYTRSAVDKAADLLWHFDYFKISVMPGRGNYRAVDQDGNVIDFGIGVSDHTLDSSVSGIPLTDWPFPLECRSGKTREVNWQEAIEFAAIHGNEYAVDLLNIQAQALITVDTKDRLEILREWQGLTERLYARAAELEAAGWTGAKTLFGGVINRTPLVAFGTRVRLYFPPWVLCLPDFYVAAGLAPLEEWRDALRRRAGEGFDDVPYVSLTAGQMLAFPDYWVLAVQDRKAWVDIIVEYRHEIHEAKLLEAKGLRMKMYTFAATAVITIATAGIFAGGGLSLLESGISEISKAAADHPVEIPELQPAAEVRPTLYEPAPIESVTVIDASQWPLSFGILIAFLVVVGIWALSA